jgi:hypothetical protein
MFRTMIAGMLIVLTTAGFAAAGTAVGIDVAVPNARIQVGTSQPPQQVRVIETERVVVHEHGGKKDNGKHKGHNKKHKKEKKHDHD